MKSMHGIAVGKVNIVIIKKRSVQENTDSCGFNGKVKNSLSDFYNVFLSVLLFHK